MVAADIDLARILLRAAKGEQISDDAAKIGYDVRAFEIAARMITQTADEYFLLQCQVARILNAVAAPVRIEVAAINEQDMTINSALAIARQEGEAAARAGGNGLANPYTKPNQRLRRQYWARGYRETNRLMNAQGLGAPAPRPDAAA